MLISCVSQLEKGFLVEHAGGMFAKTISFHFAITDLHIILRMMACKSIRRSDHRAERSSRAKFTRRDVLRESKTCVITCAEQEGSYCGSSVIKRAAISVALVG